MDIELRSERAISRAGRFIERLTIDSEVNRPSRIVRSDDDFFSWDNEHRCKKNGQPYLYSWSYDNGVIFEGLKYIYDKNGEKRYKEYIREYLDAMITDGELNAHAGYVPYHGVDCYKTASLLTELCDFDTTNAEVQYNKTAEALYRDLTVTNAKYTEKSIGGNYWHKWYDGTPPKYKVWLDGIYMTQPFLARYAEKSCDKSQMDAIYGRFLWVAENLLSPNGLYYHAGNGKDDYCDFFWLRAIGWYAMAQVDVMEHMSEEYLPEMKKNLKIFIDGMLKYQDESGMWKNLVDRPLTNSNRLETSGSSMMIYCILKAIRNGWIEDRDGLYKSAAQKAFCYITEEKLGDNGLRDIYLMAAASGLNNYETVEWYKDDEGKGTGPYIMAYSEMIKL